MVKLYWQPSDKRLCNKVYNFKLYLSLVKGSLIPPWQPVTNFAGGLQMSPHLQGFCPINIQNWATCLDTSEEEKFKFENQKTNDSFIRGSSLSYAPSIHTTFIPS
jgi:hypothetical protein